MIKLTEETIQQIRELYAKTKVYAQVARELGVSSASVKKYVLNDTAIIVNESLKKEVIKFNTAIPNINEIKKPSNDEEWKNWLCLSPDEKDECNELRKELIL